MYLLASLTIIHARRWKGGEKCGRPGIIHHVSDVRWTPGGRRGGGGGGGGGVVVSAGPEGCSRLGSNAPRLVKTQSTQLHRRFLN